MRECLQGASISSVHAAQTLDVHDAAWPDALLDTLWALDWEMEARHEAGDTSAVSLDMVRARLAALLHELVAQGVLERQKVAARIDAPLLGKLGMVDPSLFQRRGIQIRTATFFKQPKYNLLREENQGLSLIHISEPTRPY